MPYLDLSNVANAQTLTTGGNIPARFDTTNLVDSLYFTTGNYIPSGITGTYFETLVAGKYFVSYKIGLDNTTASASSLITTKLMLGTSTPTEVSNMKAFKTIEDVSGSESPFTTIVVTGIIDAAANAQYWQGLDDQPRFTAAGRSYRGLGATYRFRDMANLCVGSQVGHQHGDRR